MFDTTKLTIIGSADAANSYTGSYGELSFSWGDCLLRIHDGQTCGGKVLNETPIPFDPTALETAIAELQARNPVVGVEPVAGTSDLLVTYLDGTTITVDQPEITATTDASGLVTFDFDGTTFGPFDTGAHTVDTDTDTFSSVTDNGDGTVTVVYADGSTHTYATGPHTVDTDTDTTYTFAVNPDGSITITGSDGSTFTGPAATIDTDTDTFATLAGQTITFANGDTLVVQLDTDDQVITAADGSVDVVATTTAGQIDYELKTRFKDLFGNYQDTDAHNLRSYTEVLSARQVLTVAPVVDTTPMVPSTTPSPIATYDAVVTNPLDVPAIPIIVAHVTRQLIFLSNPASPSPIQFATSANMFGRTAAYNLERYYDPAQAYGRPYHGSFTGPTVAAGGTYSTQIVIFGVVDIISPAGSTATPFASSLDRAQYSILWVAV